MQESLEATCFIVCTLFVFSSVSMLFSKVPKCFSSLFILFCAFPGRQLNPCCVTIFGTFTGKYSGSYIQLGKYFQKLNVSLIELKDGQVGCKCQSFLFNISGFWASVPYKSIQTLIYVLRQSMCTFA